MIIPTSRQLVRRRDMLYHSLEGVLQHASVSQVECVMRRIHLINQRLKTYFQKHEPKEIFKDEDPFAAENTTPSKDYPAIEI